METEMAGKGAIGRQRLTMLDWMMKELGVSDGQQLGEIARNRKRWRESAQP